MGRVRHLEPRNSSIYFGAGAVLAFSEAFLVLVSGLKKYFVAFSIARVFIKEVILGKYGGGQWKVMYPPAWVAAVQQDDPFLLSSEKSFLSNSFVI